MAIYVIGDIQGCFSQFQALLTMIEYNPTQDVLWSVGDLVNRGPHSLETLRFFRQLDDKAVVALGNHDLHLLAVAQGNEKHLKPQDTLHPILQAPDRDDLLAWLRRRPLLHHEFGYTLIHAGLPPQWDLATASRCAAELETVLRGPQHVEFLSEYIYGNTPKLWSEDLSGWDRLRFITNCFTRLRYCDRDGALLLKKKHAPGKGTADDHPWFLHPHRASRELQIVFGHWSTLGYYAANNVYALDSGCLWGGKLTAFRLEDKQVFQHPCPQSRTPHLADE